MKQWVIALVKANALNDFLATVEVERRSAQVAQDKAADWTEAQRHLGAKLALDKLVQIATLEVKEDAANAAR